MIPSGLKSSIIPSLRTIQKFDPTWVIPNPAAYQIKRMLQFDILDEQKTAKRSNKARNPNAQKVNQCLPSPFAQVFVVNAEKVILNRLDLNEQSEIFEKTADERDLYANELRNLIGKIPNMSILIDEVHHAAKSDIKLRQVVNNWSDKGNITSVLGFSGTPYLSKAEKIYVNENVFFKFTQITNTVYYYPLVSAIRDFLKKPAVKIAYSLDRFHIIRQGIEDFQKEYGHKVYHSGCMAKVAIYCSNIEVLEEEVYPFLIGQLQINPEEILRFHKGNKQYPQPPNSELEFRSLDLPQSKKRYILLVQVGKEGWDCPSLTSVILSQKGDSPKNMVLQTSCRCLRQVDKNNENETALIWLNEYNAKTLNEQLKKEQHTSIEEINQLKKYVSVKTVPRYSRMEFLQLPQVNFYQLKIKYQSVDSEEEAFTSKKLNTLLANIDNYKTVALINVTDMGHLDEGSLEILNQTGYDFAHYNQWIYDIAKESFNTLGTEQLHTFDNQLKSIFDAITYQKNKQTFWNELYDIYEINSKIRLAFAIKKHLQTTEEIVPQKATLLVLDKLTGVEENGKLYPEEKDVGEILELDNKGPYIGLDLEKVRGEHEKAKKLLEEQGLGHFAPPFDDYVQKNSHSQAVQSKDHTFHYLPYNFIQSNFEKRF